MSLLVPKLQEKQSVQAIDQTKKQNLRAQARATDAASRATCPPYFLFAQDSIADAMASTDVFAPGEVPGAALAVAEVSRLEQHQQVDAV